MQDNPNWSEKYYSEEARAKIAERAKNFTPEMQAQTTKQWTELFRDVEASLDEDPASAKAQALAARWVALIQGFTGGDPEVQKGLNKVWKEPSGLPAATQEQMKPFSNPKVHAFIQKAVAIGKKGL